MTSITMEEAVLSAVDSAASKKDTRTAVVGNDGLLYCSVCGQPLESWHTILGNDRLLPIMCRCKEQEYERREEEQRRELIETRRRACFSGERIRLLDCTFEKDKLYSPDITKLCKGYVERFAETLAPTERQGRGLLFFGAVGTGKTFFAAAIANAVIDKGHTALFTSFNTISNQLMQDYGGKREVMEELMRPALLILDDLGAERGTEYMQEVVFSVIDERITSGRPMLITSNISADELKQPQNLHEERIYDRVLSVCVPVQVKGRSIRSRSRQSWQTEETKALKEAGSEA